MRWIFKEKKPGIITPQLSERAYDITKTNTERLMNNILGLLAKDETIRIIIEEKE